LDCLAQDEKLQPALGALRIGDYVQAIDTLQPLASNGDAEAQYLLALALETAPAPQRDLKAATGWYQRAADRGHAGALNNLGTMYYDGRGVPKDLAEAFRLYSAAA